MKSEKTINILDMYDKINDLEKRVRVLEKERYIENLKKTFKRYVIIASTDESFDVLNSCMENDYKDYLYEVKEHPDVFYYHFLREVLFNAEIIVIRKSYFDKWKGRCNNYIVTTYDSISYLLNTDYKE